MSSRQSSSSSDNEDETSLQDSGSGQEQSDDNIDTVFARHSKNVLSRFGAPDGSYTASRNAGADAASHRALLEERGKDTILEDVQRLRKRKNRTEQDLLKSRQEMSWLKVEVEALRDRCSGQAEEIERLNGRHRALLDEKVAVAEQLAVSDHLTMTLSLILLSQGPAKLPLEILLNIARFVVGNNDYGTMLSFSLMSKCIREETKAVFYETVTVYGNSFDLRSGWGGPAYSDAKRCAK